jgi:serine/threonine protein kinase
MSSLKKYRKIKYLGKGSYGAAILVELRDDTSQKFVIKEIVIGHLKPAEQQSARKEAEVLHQMNHSNITSYIESFVENSKLYIVMEHADGGDLSSAIQKRKAEGKHWDEDEVMRIFVQICLALKHVHSANILHRDLKSQNIFLTQKGMVKLGDFGIAKVLDASDDQARTQIGTPYYLSPEICESKPYGRKSDVWSLGVVLYELLALEMPFQANSLPALVHRICSAEPSYTKLETKYSSSLLSLCKTLLLKNADSRPEVGQIVRSDFIKDHISRLLSFTLKSGTGGVIDGGLAAAGGAGGAISDDHIKNIDPDEADNKIEKYREREKEYSRQHQEAQQLAKDRLTHAEEAREKARKIRQEMINRKGGESKYSEAKEQQPSSRPLSPKQPRPLSPKQQRPLSPKQQRPLSPKSAAANRNLPRNNYNEAPKANPYGKPNQPSQQYQSQQQPQGRPKTLAEIQSERQNDNVVVYASQRGGGGNEYESYARR